nr:retrovirus-related Pol polyprotein from transposon TNT 1-94 [Tanacetum cinerariifolium]
MANLLEDIQCAGSDTRPPMLDRTGFSSWQQRIRLYYWGKENGVNILKSIDEGPFQTGTVREPLAEGTERAPHLGPKQPRVYSDLSPEEKDQYNADIRATNILLQGFVTAVKLNRGLRDSNYDQLYAYLKQHETHANENKIMLDRFTQHTADPLALMSNTGDMEMFMDWFCKRQGITELKPQDLEGLAFELVKVFHPNVIHLQYQMEECHKLLTDSVDDSIIRHNVSKPLPLGGPPGQVTIQSDFFFNKDLEYLRYDSKGSRPALSISKMKAAYYLDVGLEQMVPDQMWIEKECKYDIAAMYDISHWWSPKPSTTQRQEDSHYCSQLMDQTLGYQTTRRRLPAED